MKSGCKKVKSHVPTEEKKTSPDLKSHRPDTRFNRRTNIYLSQVI
jgi:hypothetical protein